MSIPSNRFLTNIGNLANCGMTPNEATAAGGAFVGTFAGSLPMLASMGGMAKNGVTSIVDLASVSIFLPMIIFYIIVILALGLSGVISGLDALMLIVVGIIFVYIFSLIYRMGILGALKTAAKKAGIATAEIVATNIVPALDNAAAAYIAASRQATQPC